MGRALPTATPPTSTETVFLRAGPLTPPNIPSRAPRDGPCRAVGQGGQFGLPAGERTFIRLSPAPHPRRLGFPVEDGALSALAGLKPGDQVKVIYVETGDKRIIRSIVKV